LRHLAALATVAQEASFSGAAESLGYVKSAVSQQIGSLERIVGQRLVNRSVRPRSVTVTDAGQKLLDHVDEILTQLRLAKGRDGRVDAPLGPVRQSRYRRAAG
jgi:DNA-binding transcriptional LysR family regulator